MTNSTTLQKSENNITASYVLNLLGILAGSLVSAASLAVLRPIGFFAGISLAMFCFDGIK